MKLVIAEKPSVAQSIASVLGAKKRENGYWEGNGWRVSWCLGHLTKLADAESYDARFSKWRYEDLPIIPVQWHTEVASKTKSQYAILKQLMCAPEISEIINGCDAGREGELIFRSVYYQTGCNKPMWRLWISSMEDSAILEGFEHLKPGKAYDGLYQAALCRAKADWLVGINATRLFSVLYHHKLNIGRVMSPTLSMIVQRECEIARFEAKPYFNVVLELDGASAESQRIHEKTEAEQIQQDCIGTPVIVQKIEQREKKEKPPALYDLTSLQRDANRLLGYTAQQTLDYAQNLYEKKLCTYPRTDSRYITSDMEMPVTQLVQLITRVTTIGDGKNVSCNAAQIVNDKKVTDHHAIIPTKNLQNHPLVELPLGEQAIMELIIRRFLCAVGKSHRYSETVVTFSCAGHEFSVKGKTVLEPGWRAIAVEKEKEDKILPVYSEGQGVDQKKVFIKEGKTTPPKHYTEDTLLSAMETAGAKEMPDEAERKGIGTPATRAGILEKLVSTGFVERKKSQKTVQLLPSRDACALITVLPEELQSPLLTAEWEHQLLEIEHGTQDAVTFMLDISKMLKDLVGGYEVMKGTETLFTPDEQIVGKCPRCGYEVIENSVGFMCTNSGCRFAVWKNNKWWELKRKPITGDLMRRLLIDGRVPVKGLYSPQKRKMYDAIVCMEDDGSFVNFKLDFQKGERS